MKSAMVLEELGNKLGARPIVVDGGKRTKVRLDEAVLVFSHRDQSWPLSDDLMFAVADFAGLSKASAKGLSPKTFATAATELLQKKERFAILTDRDGAMTGIGAAPKGGVMDPVRVLHEIDGVLGEHADYSRALVLPGQAVQLEVATLDRQAVVVPGTHDKIDDIIYAGVMTRFSPMGGISPMVQAYTKRQWCSNGASHDIVLHTWEGGFGEGDDAWQEFRHHVQAAYDSVDRIAARYMELAGELISPADRAMVIENLIKEAKLTGEDADSIRARALAEPPNNLWEALNLLTWQTEHGMVDARKIIRAQKAHMAFDDPDHRHRLTCSACGRGSTVLEAQAHVVG